MPLRERSIERAPGIGCRQPYASLGDVCRRRSAALPTSASRGPRLKDHEPFYTKEFALLLTVHAKRLDSYSSAAYRCVSIRKRCLSYTNN